ncbi:MAG: tRNA 4-thiouridine(8) synthase ThiI [Treponema sp.]|jgi:thiamine biosynthesis protein ThiI|nr:tRNA 4-thiouridine(8) synthase ThiI [Treponema sp.]
MKTDTAGVAAKKSMVIFLLKPGELTLKGGNRREFVRVLRRNLALVTPGTGAQVSGAGGRFYLRVPDAAAAPLVEERLARLYGITGWARARVCEKTPAALSAACAEEAAALYAAGARSFKVEARRTDKSFPLSSYQICAAAGDAVKEAIPGFKVDVNTPQAVLTVEVRERAYVYGAERRGLRGLPVGTSGRGLLLLSGGIDSPVAGCLMLGRGMGLDAVYFHAAPYTSEGARQKAITLARIAGGYGLGIRLFVTPFTEVQTRIKERAPEAWRTVLLRMAMMDCAGRMAKRLRARCLVTGESLAQVASQTVENIRCTESTAGLPVLRPLIGMDKEAIVERARAFGTYETSILPYEDCCVLFSPPHPVIKGRLDEAAALYQSLEIDGMVFAALKAAERIRCGFPGEGRILPAGGGLLP